MGPLDQDAQIRTFLFMVAAFVAIVSWNLASRYFWGVSSTISWVTQNLIERDPFILIVIVFCMGLFVGHVLPTKWGQ